MASFGAPDSKEQTRCPPQTHRISACLRSQWRARHQAHISSVRKLCITSSRLSVQLVWSCPGPRFRSGAPGSSLFSSALQGMRRFRQNHIVSGCYAKLPSIIDSRCTLCLTPDAGYPRIHVRRVVVVELRQPFRPVYAAAGRRFLDRQERDGPTDGRAALELGRRRQRAHDVEVRGTGGARARANEPAINVESGRAGHAAARRGATRTVVC